MTTNTRPATDPVVALGLALPTVLAAAMAGDMPAPTDIIITNERVELTFTDITGFEAWVDWIDVTDESVDSVVGITLRITEGSKVNLPLALVHTSDAGVA